VPIIVGRAKTRGFDPDNVTDGTLIKEHPWAVDYPFYVELYDIETVDTEIKNCVSLNDSLQRWGTSCIPAPKRTRQHQSRASRRGIIKRHILP